MYFIKDMNYFISLGKKNILGKDNGNKFIKFKKDRYDFGENRTFRK